MLYCGSNAAIALYLSRDRFLDMIAAILQTPPIIFSAMTLLGYDPIW